MTRRDEIADFHGPHVHLPKPDRIKLTWNEPANRAPRIRVVSHTCECKITTYELCSAAGQGFIRRTNRKNGTVRETAWTLTAAARHTFDQILQGDAR
ncbi:hypothetical protein ACFPOI_39330 [Nonomuraea angiospora]|uniref:Uncharacterized protein n=1 Tax=Nonomuraea angiospora TaxID=46172 RepID=A0ABR9M4X2_9ACTN|nr:hypothetical protein [Nonomuraea angiospora]MBE1587958.1 hypothetical protein [Nonomuraea angiospora]